MKRKFLFPRGLGREAQVRVPPHPINRANLGRNVMLLAWFQYDEVRKKINELDDDQVQKR